LLDSNRLQVKDVLLSIYFTLPQPRSPQFLTGNFGFGSPHELLRLNRQAFIHPMGSLLVPQK